VKKEAERKFGSGPENDKKKEAHLHVKKKKEAGFFCMLLAFSGFIAKRGLI
jgi:hypothetical protein